MPYSILPADGGFKVVNTSSGKVHAEHATKENAEAQVRLLRGVEHGMVPRKNPGDDSESDDEFSGMGRALKKGIREEKLPGGGVTFVVKLGAKGKPKMYESREAAEKAVDRHVKSTRTRHFVGTHDLGTTQEPVAADSITPAPVPRKKRSG